MSDRNGIELQMSTDGEDVAYLKLPGHPGSLPGVVKRTVSLRGLLGDYSGPDLYFDFDEDNVLIGVEVLA